MYSAYCIVHIIYCICDPFSLQAGKVDNSFEPNCDRDRDRDGTALRRSIRKKKKKCSNGANRALWGGNLAPRDGETGVGIGDVGRKDARTHYLGPGTLTLGTFVTSIYHTSHANEKSTT